MTQTFLTHLHEDGAKQAYEIFGQQHLGERIPLVLVCGILLVRGDWERLIPSLSQYRPVLIFDHRGTGDSTVSTKGDEQVTLELMARDLLDLIEELNWKEVAICGYSMGGAVTQQLLFLPFHPSKPTALPFRVSHVLLVNTLSEPYMNKSLGKDLQNMLPPPNGQERPLEEQRERGRPTIQSIFDPNWIKKNPERFDWWLNRIAVGRTPKTAFMQAREISSINFGDFHSRISRDTKILVVHGRLDQVLPYSCSRVTLERLPWAMEVEIGSEPGQLPSLEFGHQWFEYFDVAVWIDLFEVFLDDASRRTLAQL